LPLRVAHVVNFTDRVLDLCRIGPDDERASGRVQKKASSAESMVGFRLGEAAQVMK
jgi:hypothetical protein